VKFALAADANQAATRSPMWFGSAALHDELGEAAEQAAGKATTAAFRINLIAGTAALLPCFTCFTPFC
jgi:hypothetical protein